MDTKKMMAVILAGIMVCATFAVVLPAMASNEALQTAIVERSTAITILAQNGETEITSIVFPSGAGGTNISNPHNDIDGSSSAQNSSLASKPLLIMKNTDASNTFKIYYNISSFTESTVSAEYYNITSTSESSVNDSGIGNSVTFDTQTDTSETIAASGLKNVYLKIKLNAAGSGNTGTSTFRILGEAA